MMRRRRKKKSEEQVLGYNVQDLKETKQLVEHIAKEKRTGKTMREILEISPLQMENLYALAYNKYQKGEYSLAADFFRYLLILDEDSYKYTLGLAASLQKNGEFEQAAHIYLLANYKNPKDPVPNFHGGLCFLETGERGLAHVSLKTAIYLAGSKKKYHELKERANLLVKKLEEEGV